MMILPSDPHAHRARAGLSQKSRGYYYLRAVSIMLTESALADFNLRTSSQSQSQSGPIKDWAKMVPRPVGARQSTAIKSKNSKTQVPVPQKSKSLTPSELKATVPGSSVSTTSRTTQSNDVGIKVVVGPNTHVPKDDNLMEDIQEHGAGGFDDEGEGNERDERDAAHSSPVKAGARLNSHVCSIHSVALCYNVLYSISWL
jgi:hypothetical protein